MSVELTNPRRIARFVVRHNHITVAVMAKKIQQLTALAVTRASKQGLYPDGAGLYLRVGRGGAKSWAFRFMLNGKAREMGLGGLTKVGLADARKKATDACSLVMDATRSRTVRKRKPAERPTRN